MDYALSFHRGTKVKTLLLWAAEELGNFLILSTYKIYNTYILIEKIRSLNSVGPGAQQRGKRDELATISSMFTHLNILNCLINIKCF